MLKRIITALLAAILLALALTSCGSDMDKFTSCAWESAVGITEFKESGKICYNFEPESESVSYFKLLSGDRINLYTEEGEKFGMIFDYRFEDDCLYIGEAKYTKSSVSEYIEDKLGSDENTESAE